MWIPSLQGSSVDRILTLPQFQDITDAILPWTRELFISALIIAIFWGLSRIITYVLTVYRPCLVSCARTDLLDRMLLRVTPPLGLLTIFAGIYVAVRNLPLPDKIRMFVTGSVFIVTVSIFAGIAYRMTDEALSWYTRRAEERTGAVLGTQILPLVRKVFLVFLVCASLIVVLKHFDCDILSLVTALGIGSLAIGLAAKDTLANMISGFTLMIDRPFRIGDRIQVAAGKTGDVVDIGLRSTRIKTPENTLLIIPNAELCNSTVLNMVFPDLRTQGRISVGVSLDSDPDAVKKVMVETAMEDPDILHDPPPEAFFLSIGESALNMALFFWVNDYTKIFQVTDRLNTRIVKLFAANDIRIPYPTRTVLMEKEG
jgi:small-conductance mechanosensitive channel